VSIGGLLEKWHVVNVESAAWSLSILIELAGRTKTKMKSKPARRYINGI
jgi:hypothetical protein